MDSQFIHFLEKEFKSSIRNHLVLDATKGEQKSFPDEMDARLTGSLRDMGISSLYTHQLDAYDSIHQGNNSLIVSRTASGKTLSFFLPILQDYLTSKEPFSVLLLYPTKALSRDQEGTLGKLLRQTILKNDDRAVVGNKLGTFDGDTPREERETLQKSADFLITNPDMLHSGILPNNNRKWRNFLSRLKYIVVDEVHTYRGSFGSHVSNVFRRLLRVSRIHGGNPIIVGASATVGNPKEHAEALFHKPFHLIDQDGAPKPRRDLYFVNPPLVRGQGDSYYRKGTGSIAVPLLRYATEKGIRSICFCRSRQQVERLYRAVVDGFPELRDKVKPYRGGLLPNERRQLEKDLFEGRITTIISTNALELGIDIGGLDLCLLSGHPGSAASFWQQAGRVGRNGQRSVIVYLAKNTPVDQYIVQNSDYIANAPMERAWINGDNPYIFLQHLPCAAQEYPLSYDDEDFDPMLLNEGINLLLEDGNLKPYKERFRYAGDHFPSRGVNLRGMTDYNIEIYCGSEVIGEIDPIGARGELYKDAIYQHLGRRFMSMDLDLEKKLCRVEPINVDYYTEAVWESRVELTDLIDSKQVFENDLQFGAVHVHRQPKLYKKIRERSFENIGYGPITLEAFEYDTMGMNLRPNREWQKAINKEDKRYVGAALYGLAYLLKRIGPSFFMGDKGDIETDVALSENGKKWESALFLYDSIEGGVGYGEKVYEVFTDILEMCGKIIAACECEMGCPACVPPLPPGVEEEELEELFVQSDAAIECTQACIQYLLTGEMTIPKVTTFKKTLSKEANESHESEERIKLRSKLSIASKVLARKRAREH